MDYIAQYSNIIFGGLLVLILMSMITLVVIAACSGSTTTQDDYPTGKQTQNVGQYGGSRHSWKDINSY